MFVVLRPCGGCRLTAERLPPLALHLSAPYWRRVDELLPQSLVGHHPLHVGHASLLRGGAGETGSEGEEPGKELCFAS